MRRGERGAATVEHIGVIVLVVAVVAAVVMAATPVGQAIAAKLCQAVGAQCGADVSTAPSAPKEPPSDPYVASAIDFGGEISLSASIVESSLGRKYILESRSDGTWVVSTRGETGAKVVGQAGPDVSGHLRLDGDGPGVELSQSVEAGVLSEVGLDREFETVDQAKEFLEWQLKQDSAIARGATKGAGRIDTMAAGAVIEVLKEKLRTKLFGGYEPPGPDAVYLEAGGELAGKMTGDVALAGGAAEVNGSGTLGAKYEPKSGDITQFRKVTVGAEERVSLGFDEVSNEEANVEFLIEVERDRDGRLKKVALTGIATGEGMPDLTSLAGQGLELQTGSDSGVAVDLSFDVTDENRKLAERVISESYNPLKVVGVVEDITDESHRSGDVAARTMKVNKVDMLSAGLSLKAPAIGGGGAGIEIGGEAKWTDGAWYHNGHGWTQWEADQ